MQKRKMYLCPPVLLNESLMYDKMIHLEIFPLICYFLSITNILLLYLIVAAEAGHLQTRQGALRYVGKYIKYRKVGHAPQHSVCSLRYLDII